MKKKICYVVTIAATIESFFIPQLKYLAENGLDVTVICSPSDTFDLQEKLGDSIRYIPLNIPRGVSTAGLLKAIRQLRTIFKREKFDLVQYSTPNAGFCASIAAKQAGVAVRNYHLMGLRYLGAAGVTQRFLKRIEKITCNHSTHIECISKSNLELCLKDDLFPPQKAVIVWNGSTGGVDLNRFDYNNREQFRSAIRDQYQISEDQFVFGFVGRITEQKGVNELLEAFLKIENAKLFMIGRMDDVSGIQHDLLEKSKNHKDIIYSGNVDNVEMYFSALDALLLPSYREGFGNVVIEAAAMGTPAIISDIPGPTDAVIPEVTAKLVRVKDAESLYQAMKSMTECDYREFGLKAKEYVVTHFDSKVLNEYILERKCFLLENSINQ